MRSRRAVMTLVVTAVAMVTVVSSAAPAPAAFPNTSVSPFNRLPVGVLAGNDISWPQCPSALGGYANPLPTAGAQFVVIGLSHGQSFTTNRCLKDQVAWARARHLLVSGYVFPTYPTNAQYALYGAQGPYSTTTVDGRLMNVGYQQASYWAEAARTAELSTPMIWVDVENAKRGAPWSPRGGQRNLPVIRGVLAGLQHAGYRTGIYTTSSHWKQITGGAQLGEPEWRTVGLRGTPTTALATCTTPGVQGGPVLLAQYYSATVDYDLLCPGAAAQLPRLFAQY